MSGWNGSLYRIVQSGEEDAPGGQADGTPKPHNINREIFWKLCILIPLHKFWNNDYDLMLFPCVLDTPILGSRMPMRRETLKAIETARDNLMQVALLLCIIVRNTMKQILSPSQCDVLFWLLLRRGSKARWELSGLQILTTTTRTNTGQIQGNLCNQQSKWIIVLVSGSLGTRWREFSHQEHRAWIIRSCQNSAL